MCLELSRTVLIILLRSHIQQSRKPTIKPQYASGIHCMLQIINTGFLLGLEYAG